MGRCGMDLMVAKVAAVAPGAKAHALVTHAFIVAGIVLCGMGLWMAYRGEWTIKGVTSTREDHPLSFLLAVAAMLFVGLFSIYIGVAL